MFTTQQLKKEIRKDNSRFDSERTRLRTLLTILERRMPKPNAYEVAKEMSRVPPRAWTKYKFTRKYLEKNFPGLQTALVKSKIPLRESPPGYQAGKLVRRKDEDGRWFELCLQRRGCSCGPACVLIAKLLWHPNAKGKVREPEIRGLVAQSEARTLHTGVSSLSQATMNLHDWENVGAYRPPLLEVLKGQPFRVPSARPVSLSKNEMYDELNKCSSKYPAIVYWLWTGGSGAHWTVCIGPTRNRLNLIILDPWDEIQYVRNDRDRFTSYMNGAGTMDHSDALVGPILTHPARRK